MNPITYAERIAYSTKRTLNHTEMWARKLRHLDGVYLEAGVAAGAQVIAMLVATECKKEIWAFDSFEGIPLPSNRDDQMPGIAMLSKTEQKMLPNPGEQVLKSSGATVVSLTDFLNHITNAFGYIPEVLYTEVGWFENTVKNFNKPIAFLRLDGDLYNSTYVCLKYLFPLVVIGGGVLIDDINLNGCHEAVKDYFNEIEYDVEWMYIGEIAYFEKK